MDEQSDRKTAEPGINMFRRLILSQIAGDIDFDEEKVPCNTPRSSVHSRIGGSLGKMAASTSGSNGTASMNSGEYVRDPSSILSLQPWIFKRSGSQNDEEKIDKCGRQMNGFADGSILEISPRSIGLCSGPGRGRGAVRSRRPRRHLVKPLTSMENSFIPQLYNENFDTEEYMFGPFPSPATARPFIVTDGRKIISKSNFEPLPVPFDIGFRKEVYRDRSKMAESVVGVSPLPELRKSKQKSREMHHERLGASSSQSSSKQSHSHGLLDRMLIFSVGISIGILSSSLSTKKEVDTLKDTLKLTENLVQDLQEELEMKESLTVKELPNEASRGREDEDSQTQVPEAESMSKIEAELEAELARLELNMTSNNLERRISGLSEVDPELIGDIVQGELKADMVHHNPGDYSSESDHGRDSKGSSTDCAHEANYPVSPRELSVRLHKVIQHRLEGRIKELEAVLAHSQKQLQMQMMESERVFSERSCSNSDLGSSSNQESPVFIQDSTSLVQPFCLNLAGDALDAYDEAYEEFMRIADSPCKGNEEYSVDRNLARKLKRVPTWERILKSSEANEAQESDRDDEDEFDDDDDSKLLIQQIVERTKQGSPVLIHAQRMLFSVDE